MRQCANAPMRQCANAPKRPATRSRSGLQTWFPQVLTTDYAPRTIPRHAVAIELQTSHCPHNRDDPLSMCEVCGLALTLAKALLLTLTLLGWFAEVCMVWR